MPLPPLRSLRNLIVLNKHCTEHDISLRQLALMTVLLQEGPRRPIDLATRLHITPAAITGQLDALEVKGFTERKLVSGDRRANAIHLTPSGKALIDQADRLAA
jgi:DNA-binding MarR family transcriptional regulator